MGCLLFGVGNSAGAIVTHLRADGGHWAGLESFGVMGLAFIAASLVIPTRFWPDTSR